MPIVIIRTPNAADVVLDAKEGGSLADLCDAHQAPIPFSCRSANCGTCRVEVLDGKDELYAAEKDELDVLEIFAAPKTHRLACCAKMKPGSRALRIRPVGDDE